MLLSVITVAFRNYEGVKKTQASLAHLAHAGAHVAARVEGVALAGIGVEQLHARQACLGKGLRLAPLRGADAVEDEGGVHQLGDLGLAHLQLQHALLHARGREAVAQQGFVQHLGHVLEGRFGQGEGAGAGQQQGQEFFHRGYLRYGRIVPLHEAFSLR